jgi:hypothetical protein
MSTNYYAHGPDLPDGGLHIGQHSLGWEFLFRAHRDRGLTSTRLWFELLCLPGVEIRSEFGTSVPLCVFWADLTRRFTVDGESTKRFGVHHRKDEFRDGRGRPFLDADFC